MFSWHPLLLRTLSLEGPGDSFTLKWPLLERFILSKKNALIWPKDYMSSSAIFRFPQANSMREIHHGIFIITLHGKRKGHFSIHFQGWMGAGWNKNKRTELHTRVQLKTWELWGLHGKTLHNISTAKCETQHSVPSQKGKREKAWPKQLKAWTEKKGKQGLLLGGRKKT